MHSNCTSECACLARFWFRANDITKLESRSTEEVEEGRTICEDCCNCMRKCVEMIYCWKGHRKRENVIFKKKKILNCRWKCEWKRNSHLTKVDISLWLIDTRSRSFKSCQKLENYWKLNQNWFDCVFYSHYSFWVSPLIKKIHLFDFCSWSFDMLGKIKCLFVHLEKYWSDFFCFLWVPGIFLWNLFKAIFSYRPQ